MLKNSFYPAYLKARIKSNNGHLSNNQCADAIVAIARTGTRFFALCHLSENNNIADLARSTFEEVLTKNDIDINKINLSFASKNLSTEVFKI